MRARRMINRRNIKLTQDYFEIRRSPIQGLGAFALKRIRKGTRVIEYTGERVSHAEADRRYDDSTMKRHTTYLFVVNGRTVVDATSSGNEARFINHSCAPNCESLIDGTRIFIEAIRTIEPGEELVYDYRFERTGEPGEEKRYICKCGAPTCRGTIMLPEEPKKGRQAKKNPRRSAKRTGSAKKGAAKKGAAKKGSVRTATRRGAAKKGAAKKSAVKKGAAKKSATKKSATRKSATRKSATR
jgi:hypothetical protein